ncbi:TraB/GumN family protein [Kaarinaea lacus]
MIPDFKHRPWRHHTALVLLFLILFASHSAYAKSFFWHVKSPTTTVYLLGSIHFAKPDIYPLDEKIENAFEKAAFLVVELDQKQLDQDNMRRYILKHGMYEKPDSVESHISESTLALLKDYLDRYDMPLQGYNRMKPGFLAMTLSIAHVIRLGYLPDYGIDMYFLNKAQDKKVLQLENYADQLDLFFDMPDEELFLKHTLTQLEDIEKQIDETVTAWKNGNTQQMVENVLIEPQKDYPELRDVYTKIYTDRNIKMANQISQYLEQKSVYFVVVGAGHLIGDQGIVNLIKKRGYKVKQY